MLNAAETKPAFDTAAGRKALRFMYQLAHTGDGAVSVVSANAYITDGFNDGSYATDFDSSAGVAYLTNPKLHYASAPLPAGTTHAVSSGGTNVVLFKQVTALQKAAAIKYIEYLLSDKTTVAWAENTGYLPMTNSALQTPAWKSFVKTHPNAGVAADSAKYAFYEPRVATMSSAISEIDTQIGNYIAGKQTLNATMVNMVQQVDEALSSQ